MRKNVAIVTNNEPCSIELEVITERIIIKIIKKKCDFRMTIRRFVYINYIYSAI